MRTEDLRARIEKQIKWAYAGADVWDHGELVMDKGKVLNDEWYEGMVRRAMKWKRGHRWSRSTTRVRDNESKKGPELVPGGRNISGS